MAEKAKAKKAKALTKKTSVKSKKREPAFVAEVEVEDLQLEAEEMPKRSARGKASAGTATATPPAAAHATPAATTTPNSATTIEATKPHIKVKAPVTEENEIKVQNTPEREKEKEVIAPIQPRVVLNKPETPRAEPQPHRHENVRSEAPRQETRRPESNQEDGLRLRLSQSLTKKLKEQAADEGISLEEFVGELLAESVVLRAWEIVERKNAMKGPSQQGQNSGGGQRPNSRNNNNSSNQGGDNRGGGPRGQNQGNKGHRGMSHVRYQTIMDDKATFLEYVRSQEKARR